MTDFEDFSLAPTLNPTLPPLLLIFTHSPHDPHTTDGINFAKRYVTDWQQQSDEVVPLTIFCYGDGAYLANRLIWLPDDMFNAAKDLQQFVQCHHIAAQVCVSTALARGVVDSDNAQRHQLQGENLADGFELVGLGELAMHLHQYAVVKQF